MITTEVAAMTFKVWITLPGGERIAHTAEDFELEKECAWQPCSGAFRTKYFTQDYCSNDCAKNAANQRYKSRGSTPTP